MSSELTEIIIPSIAFFVGFLLAFYLIELFVILILNGFVYKHWSFVVDVVMRVKVRHGKAARNITLASIIILLVILFKYTAVIQALRDATMEEKLYAAQIILVIFLVYFGTTRYLTDLTFLKQIHRYLFIYFSMIVFVFMVLIVNQQYENYQRLINAKIVYPITKKTEVVMENYKRKKLLNEVRRMIHNGRCPRVDFTERLVQGEMMHFVYVTTDPALSISNITTSFDEAISLTVGRSCTYENETFLLTDHGQWFWVIDAEKLSKSFSAFSNKCLRSAEKLA